MRNVRLPVTVTVGGTEYPINRNGDYEVILDILEVLEDEELTDAERAGTALSIFYDFHIPDNAQEAIDAMMVFINCGEEIKEKPNEKAPLMNWNKDFPMLVAPINKVIGYDVRSVPYVHWWTFVAAYMEIGECSFSSVVDIRRKRRDGEKLDKAEQRYYEENREKIDAVSGLSKQDMELLDDF